MYVKTAVVCFSVSQYCGLQRCSQDLKRGVPNENIVAVIVVYLEFDDGLLKHLCNLRL